MTSNKVVTGNGVRRFRLLPRFSGTAQGPVYAKGLTRWLAPSASSLRESRGLLPIAAFCFIIKWLNEFVK